MLPKVKFTVTLKTHIVPLVSRVTVISCPPNNEPELSRPERAIGFEPRGRSCVLLHFLIPPPAGSNKLAVASKARAMNATCKCLALDKDDYDVDDIWVEFKKKRGMRTANKTNATHPARAAVALSVASVDPASGPQRIWPKVRGVPLR